MNLKQPRTTSLNESLLNTGSGFGLSLFFQWLFLVVIIGLPMTWDINLGFALVMTVVSVARGFLWRRYFESRRISFKLSPFLLAVIAERQRQIDVEGYDAAHDDDHADGECARAGAAYLFAGSIADRAHRELLPRCDALDVRFAADGAVTIRRLWPWDWEFWKPKADDRRRDLVRGCALGLAEGEKLERKRRLRRREQRHLDTGLAPGYYEGMGAGFAVEAPPPAHGKTRSEQGGAP